VIYVLEKGCVSGIGSHDELLQNKGLYYAMWRQQVGEKRQDIAQDKNEHTYAEEE
jgi:ATP-binding cassette subfamily B protein